MTDQSDQQDRISMEGLNAVMPNAAEAADSMHAGLHEHKHSENKVRFGDYFSLMLVFAYISIAALVSAYGQDNQIALIQFLRYFEGFFFLIFSLFKVIDWKGFADGFAEYDVIAKRIKLWAYLYPLVELGLALGFLSSARMEIFAIITIIISTVGALGVINDLSKKRAVRCACLGTVIKIPLTQISLAEYLLMIAMSVAMLLM